MEMGMQRMLIESLKKALRFSLNASILHRIADNAQLETDRSLLMLHNPAEDAPTEFDDHEPDNTPTDKPFTSVAHALEILNRVLRSGKKHSHLNTA